MRRLGDELVESEAVPMIWIERSEEEAEGGDGILIEGGGAVFQVTASEVV